MKFQFIKNVSLAMLVCFTALANAQGFEQPLVKWNRENPIQKLYLHLDRENYFAGQTIWFKSYFMSGFLPSAANSTLFVELLSNRSQVILKKTLPAFGAISYGQMELPDTLGSGAYQLRAYTPLMLNHNKEYLFARRINIFGKARNSLSPTPAASAARLRFFPEGGHFVAGLPNRIAFLATDENGLPANVSGEIKNKRNVIIARFSSMHNGMGLLTLQPETDEKYFAETTDGTQFPLPEATQKGITVQIQQEQKSLQFILRKPNDHAAFTPAYILGQMQHQIVFTHTISNAGKTITGKIQTSQWPSGVLHLTIFNKDSMPLAERLVFINNNEYRLDADFSTDRISNSKRKLNDYFIQLKDSVTGNFSVSVTDADYDAPGPRTQNIISAFLLTGDIPGYVHNPAWYFSEAENTTQALDLVMMTHGWRRFKWTDVANNNLPAPQHKDQGFISLSGEVKIKGSGKSFANRDLMIWVATPDAAQNIQLVKTDAQGRFNMDSMVFFDKAKILFSDVMGKKSKFITVELDADSLYGSYDLPPLHIPYARSGSAENNLAQKMNTAFFDYSRGQGLMLDNVLVKGNKTRLQRLEELYLTGLFAGGINARTFDLSKEFMPQWNIFEYLQGRVPGLWIERESSGFMGNYSLYYRQAGARRPMQIYLDEMLMPDASMISAIPASDIALVKIFPTFVGAPGGGANGVIAIYTKRGIDIDEYAEGTGEIIDYDGYSIIKEFYAPDYSKPAETHYTDYRLTLDWKPEIFVSGMNQKIPVRFYNNDRTKRFKIVAEGITGDGKLLMVEKIVEAPH